MIFNFVVLSATASAQAPQWDPVTMRDEMSHQWHRTIGTYYYCFPEHDDEKCRAAFGPSFRCVTITDPNRNLYKATECAPDHDAMEEPCDMPDHRHRRLDEETKSDSLEVPTPAFRRQSMGHVTYPEPMGSAGMEIIDRICFRDSECSEAFGSDSYCMSGAGWPIYPRRFGLCVYPWVSEAGEDWSPCDTRDYSTGFCLQLKPLRRLESDDAVTMGEAPKPELVPALNENELPATRRIERTAGGCPLDSEDAAWHAPCGAGVRRGTECHYQRCAETHAYGIYICTPEGWFERLRTEYGECSAWNGRIFGRGDVMGTERGDELYDWNCPGGKRCEGVPGSHENGEFGKCLKTAAEVMNELYPGH